LSFFGNRANGCRTKGTGYYFDWEVRRSVLAWRRGETRGPHLRQRLALHRYLGDVPQERVKLVVGEIRAHATEPRRGLPHDLGNARGASGVRVQSRLEFNATIGHVDLSAFDVAKRRCGGTAAAR
jgi:hypothetical protein